MHLYDRLMPINRFVTGVTADFAVKFHIQMPYMARPVLWCLQWR